uniref:Uncharacterized protein n=1 Tax=Candidatus Kentrum sp. LFY TaxID=2126342 RepID=A0A450WI75_9GAMM|nr:MAG: hypothetical protein BECKLFY1418C_GA0070996_102545 [Candidatus Kentron sp. LFY]
MTWQTIALRPPATATAFEGAFDGLKDAASMGIGDARTRLENLVEPPRVPSPGAGAGAVGMPELGGDGHLIVIHPYQLESRHGAEYRPSLSFPNAATAAAGKISAIQASSLDILAIAITGSRLDQWAASLATFTGVFPIPELLRVRRRAEAMLTIEKDKFTRPPPRKSPDAIGISLQHLPVLQDMNAALRARCALSRGYRMENLSAAGHIAGLLTKKQAHLDDLSQRWTNLTTALHGGAGLVRRLQGGPASAARALTDNTPGHEYSMTALLILAGPPGGMTALFEMFGLN